MSKCAVIIGINATGYMPILKGAASGARQFDDWAKSNGFDTSLHVDDGGSSVHFRDVFTAVKGFVDKGVYELMIIYFAGHGILKAPGEEIWLLSEAPTNAGEAVNVRLSDVYSRSSTIPHIAFFSDACRSIPDNQVVLGVTGAPIFPNQPPSWQNKPAIDIFYATMPGAPSYETVQTEAVDAYQGIYTECLLNALNGNVSKIIKRRDIPHKEQWGIFSRELQSHLEEAVPLAASQKDITLIQIPDGYISSLNPKWLAEVTKSDPRNYPEQTNEPPTIEREPETKYGRSSTSDFKKRVKRLVRANKEQSFLPFTGFLIIGNNENIDTTTRTGDFHFTRISNKRLLVYIHNEKQYKTFLLKFKSGYSTPLAILPGFHGTIIIEREQVINVNYSPNIGTDRHANMVPNSNEVEKRRATIATAAYYGKLFFRSDRQYLVGLGDFLRSLKTFDPTLGLYAAYAYAAAGEFEHVYSVHNYMAKEPEPVLFDVELLATLYRKDGIHPFIAPQCPMLTQGWAFLASLIDEHPVLKLTDMHHLVAELVPGLWTTFTPKGTNLFEGFYLDIL